MTGLSNKQQVFVNEYLKCWNASEAARRAGYNGKSDVIGSRLLGYVSIKAAIKERLEELTMSADEALATLTAQARGDMGEFITFKDGVKTPYLDLKAAYDKGLFKLVKKFRYNADGQPEIELYDAQAAIKAIRDMRGLDAPTKQEYSGPNGGELVIKVKYESDNNPDDSETT